QNVVTRSTANLFQDSLGQPGIIILGLSLKSLTRSRLFKNATRSTLGDSKQLVEQKMLDQLVQSST
ncbi:MAG: hypothetical protein ACK5PZ_18470, partial [Pirellula sp.]